jgi:hypothetical protein
MDRIRLAIGVVLLAIAGYSVWQTIGILGARRDLRTDLAELNHVRYGVLNADRWVQQIVPILNAQIDSLDLMATNGASLRPTVVNALNRLLEQLQTQLVPKPKPGATPGFLEQAQTMMVNNMLASLKPDVPEYADMLLKELGKPENKQAIREYIRSAVSDGAKTTFGAVDMRTYNAILRRYGCADGAACQKVLTERISGMNSSTMFYSLLALAACGLAFLLLNTRRIAIAIQLLCCLALLLGGILSPMLEVEAKISKISLTFFGQPISFSEQVLYYQSKSVLEVFKTLITLGQVEMTVVAVLVLMFSVVFPAFKVITTALCLHDPTLPAKYRLARFFALESSKWSMADVMALAIFMSFVAFNGLIASAMSGLQSQSAQLVIPTDSSKTLPGYYLFVGFCVTSLWLAKKLQRSLQVVA